VTGGRVAGVEAAAALILGIERPLELVIFE
jgi:hypothetical protein